MGTGKRTIINPSTSFKPISYTRFFGGVYAGVMFLFYTSRVFLRLLSSSFPCFVVQVEPFSFAPQ